MVRIVSVEKEPVVSPIRSITLELTADEADLIVSLLARTTQFSPGKELYAQLSSILRTTIGSYILVDSRGKLIPTITANKER